MEDNYDADSGLDFLSLSGGVQTAIVDLSYQYGTGLSTAAPNFWNDVTTGNWTAAVNELRDFGDDYPTRRGLEAGLIQNDLDSGVLPESSFAATLTGISSMVEEVQIA